MVNKKRNEVGMQMPASFIKNKNIFAYAFLGVFFSFLVQSANSQNVSKLYSAMQQETGTLYFVRPMKGFQNVKTNKDFVFDITYLDSSDSLTVNFTYTDKLLLQIDSLSLQSSDNKLISGSPAAKIYVESSKSGWIYRYGARFSFADFNSFIHSSDSPAWIIQSKEQPIPVKMKNSKWEKLSQNLLRVFDIMQLNKKN